MYRTKTCGELRLIDAGKEVVLAGWVQRSRKMGGMTFVDCATVMVLHNLYLTKLKMLVFAMKLTNWDANIAFV